MGGFFKRLFCSDKENLLNEDELDFLNKVSNEIMTEEKGEKTKTSVKTNKLSDVFENIATEVLGDFSCYEFYSYSHVGMVKKSNQDSVFTSEFTCRTENKTLHVGVGIVADGMGGLAMGEIASSTAIASVSTYMQARLAEYIQNGLPKGEVIFDHIVSAVQNANRIVKEKGDELGEDIGTTFSLALLIGKNAYFGHVGDSRVYIINLENKSIEKVTKDHSLVGRLIEMGEISEKEAKSHPRRNEIYRMLGLREDIKVDTYFKSLNSNSIIVMVSDGLWEFVDDDEILNEILISNNLSETAKNLVDMANDNGGHDNISVIIIKPIE